MTKAQKIIKYIAISVAVLLIVSIFYGILGVISNIFGFTLNKETNEYKITEISGNISKLDIEIESSKLTFKNADVLKVEANNDNIKINESRNKLTIEEKNNLFNQNTNEEIIIYIPINKIFQEVVIEAGSGNIEIAEINTNKLELDLGAGAINIDKLNVTGEADIDSGAGKVEIYAANVNNLDLDMGIGEVVYEGILTGNNDIDAGVGALKINLQNSLTNYKFNVNKGIGEIKLNKEIINNNYQTLGTNSIKIDGGIGSINIETID